MNKDNKIYLYIGSFNDLINLISYLLKNKIIPSNIKSINYNKGLFDEVINVKTHESDLINYIIKISSKYVFKIIYYVYLSNDENKELIIYYFILNTFKYGNKIIYMRNLKCVNESLKLEKYVSRENHKFKGFTRFKELNNNVLYSKINPTNNIIILLAEHFKNRLKEEYFILHDEKRNIYVFYDKNKYYVVSDSELKLLNIEYSENEKDIENMWCSFYKTIAIKERKNEKVRMNFMPKKYWKNIVEMRNINENSN